MNRKKIGVYWKGQVDWKSDLETSGNEAGLGVSVSLHPEFFLHILFNTSIPTRFITFFSRIN